MRSLTKRRLLAALCGAAAVCLALLFVSPVRAAEAETEGYARGVLPNEISAADYAAQFGARGEKGWGYEYRTPGAEGVWSAFTEQQYDEAQKLYAAEGATLSATNANPAGGVNLKRTYSAGQTALVRFALILYTWSANGESGDVNLDGQRFYIEVDGVRQTLHYAKLGTAENDAAVDRLIEECALTEADYTAADALPMPNTNGQAVYLAYADVAVTEGKAAELILDTDGDGDGFAGVWCDGSMFKAYPFLSYYGAQPQAAGGATVHSGTLPGDFGCGLYFKNDWNDSDKGIPYPNPYRSQYSGEQGVGNWYYMYGKPDYDGDTVTGHTPTELTFDAASKKYLPPAEDTAFSDDFFNINIYSMVPNKDRPAIKAYRAPKTGLMRFVAVAYHEQNWQGGPDDFDGMDLYARVNGGEKLPLKYGRQAVAETGSIEDGTAVTYTEGDTLHLSTGDASWYNVVFDNVAVNKGDFVYFYVDAAGESWCDEAGFGIVPIYTWLDPADAIGPEEFTPESVFDEYYALANGNKQNTNGWHYLFGDCEREYYELVLSGNDWASGFGPKITSKTMTPAVGYDAIRLWRAETSGKVRVLGLIHKLAAGGDGATFTVTRLNSGAHTFEVLHTIALFADDTEEKQLMLGSPGVREEYIDVAAGDMLAFNLNAGADAEADETAVKLYVAYTERGEDSSETDIEASVPEYTYETVLPVQFNGSTAMGQGANGWYKFFGSEKEYYKMRSDGTRWVTGYEGGIKGSVYTPSKRYATINAYRAPSTGTLNVLGSVQKEETGGDGVRISVYRLRGETTELIETLEIAADDTEEKRISLGEEARGGDMYFFSVQAVRTVEQDAVTLKLFAYYSEITSTPDLPGELGDSEPPVKGYEEWTADDVTDKMYADYMTPNFDAQGTNGWYYLYGIGDTAYYLMEKNGARWQGPGSDPYNIIENVRGVNPGNVWDTIYAYQVKDDGYMRLFGHFNFWQGAGGDGVKITVKNVASGEVLYNEIFKGGPDWEQYHTMQTDEFKVSRGDVLFFIINRGGAENNNQFDNVTFSVYPVYSIVTKEYEAWPEGGIGAKPFDAAAVPPEPEEEETPGSVIVAIPMPEQPEQETGLGAGAVAGIAVGAAAFAGIAGFAVYWFVRRRKKKT